MGEQGHLDRWEGTTSPLPAPQPRPPSAAPPPPPDPIPAAQAVVGRRYRIERLAGTGGMGRVFQATDEVLGRRIAIKLSTPTTPTPPATGATSELDETERTRLIAEARAMAGLAHPNVCRIIEVGLDAPVPFLIMEWVEGVELGVYWSRLDLKRRLALFVQIVDAVAAVHAAGLVHRDLKPANILVDNRGEPVIVDFGLAHGGASGRDGSGGGGTPGYAAPEQFESNAEARPVTTASDVYSLGAILFQMLTDRLPFEGTSAGAIIDAARAEDPPLPESLAPRTPAPLQRVTLMALERDPARRYPHAAAMAQDLRRYLRGETVVARPSMLADRFTEQVEQQLERTRDWLRLGLITKGEGDALQRNLARIIRADSPWIADARRLSVSQVSLYIGGWLVMLAAAAGTWWSWDRFAPWARIALPWAVAGVLGVGGVYLHRRGDRRASLGYLLTATLALPAAAWFIFLQTGWLSAAGTGMGPQEALIAWGIAEPAPRPGGGQPLPVYNAQLLAITGVWLVASLACRLLTGSGAFSLTGVLATVGAWTSGWLVMGRLHADDRGSSGELGMWLAAIGAALILPGIILNRREEDWAREFGRARQRRHDAWPTLTVAVLLVSLGLAAAAYFAPERLFLLPIERDPPPPGVERQAAAFILGGLILLALSTLLSWRETSLRRWLATLLRWLIPSHFLGAVLALEIEGANPGWGFWLALLGGLCIAISFASAMRQWKPFLVTGLAYLAVAYRRAYVRLVEPGDPIWLAVLTAGIVLVGLAVMVLAWRAPAWAASGRMAWWLRMARRRKREGAE